MEILSEQSVCQDNGIHFLFHPKCVEVQEKEAQEEKDDHNGNANCLYQGFVFQSV